MKLKFHILCGQHYVSHSRHQPREGAGLLSGISNCWWVSSIEFYDNL
jgi:hypothetical protein